MRLPWGIPCPAEYRNPTVDRAARGAETEQGTLRVALNPDQRREVARLLGTPWELTDRPVRLQDLGAVLAEHGLTVRGFVEGIDEQPLVNLRQRRADERSWARNVAERERASVVELLECVGFHGSVIQLWLDDMGMPKAGSGELLALAEQVVVVWRQRPGPGCSISLAQLAASVGGHDAHALDYSRLLGRATGLRKPFGTPGAEHLAGRQDLVAAFQAPTGIAVLPVPKLGAGTGMTFPRNALGGR